MFLSLYLLCGFSSGLSPVLASPHLSQVFMSEKEYNARIVGRKLHYSQAHLLFLTEISVVGAFLQIVEHVCTYKLKLGACSNQVLSCFPLVMVSFFTWQISFAQ